MANALSAARLLAAPLFWMAMVEPGVTAAFWSAVLFVAAIATDLQDGRIARSRGTESALGRALDHGADFAFVTTGLAAASLRGSVPALLPLFIVLAFAQYVVDSFVLHSEKQLRMSRLGRSNGILYFVPLGGDILVRLGLGFLALPVLGLGWALVLTTLASMVDRLLALPRRSRTAPGSPSGGTPDR